MKSAWLYLGVMVFLILVVVVSLLFKPQEVSQLGLIQGRGELLGVANCDAAQSPCRIDTQQGALTLFLEPPVTALQPFMIRLHGERFEASQLFVTFTMVGMDMGLNRFVLEREAGEWRGKGILPICSESRHDWLATLNFVSKGQPYRVEFPFVTQ
ncbi:MAG: hypothetical protein HUJ29_07070 [Gammaproteobacteria bacterium]|nr:hypothetical protein [Gammaproteobacteria bacterium]